MKIEYTEQIVRQLTYSDGQSEIRPLSKADEPLVFKSQILDNVHGFISYTEAEFQIMNTLLFKRLQSIKQLSVVNWVFPGSEHTRYIHSLGVMHVADKMAMSMRLSNRERRILRMAGLLHDIGHYPLSHVGEHPYQVDETAEREAADAVDFCELVNEEVVKNIKNFSIRKPFELMSCSDDFHHEAVGAAIVKNNKEIRKIVEDELGEGAAEIIADIITGNVEREVDDPMKWTDPLWVQIMHSELDADGIDYIMRDSASAGTSFGACEIEQLIRCLRVGKLEDGTRIMCIKPKGIPAADQYLINKFFHYSQVVFNRHIVICEMMAMKVIGWMLHHNRRFPGVDTLQEWMDKGGTDGFLEFTDDMFWRALAELKDDPSVPDHIQLFSKYLLRHEEPVVAKPQEIRIVSHVGRTDKDESEIAERIRDRLKNSETYQFSDRRREWLTSLEIRRMSKQLPKDLFDKAVKKNFEENYKKGSRTKTKDKLAEYAKAERLRKMECICVREHIEYDEKGEEKPHVIRVLCDDDRSIMRDIYDKTLVILRSYEYPKPKK